MTVLTPPVSKRDHLAGSLEASVVLLEFGDYECPHCAAAFPVVKTIQAELGDDLCFAFRYFPLVQIHPHALGAAVAAESAGMQGRFWDMHDMMFEHSPELREPDLLRYASEIGLDLDRFRRDLRNPRHLARVEDDIDSGLRSGVTGTPTFFINGVRHMGGYDLASLMDALKVAR
jgi:protein-disulfide isomerase